MSLKTPHSNEVVRYAVVGLGNIAQTEFLPAFRRVKENSRLTALVSDDPEKLEELTKRYKGVRGFSYEEYDTCLQSGEIDAVVIALPNDLHCDYTIRAAKAGIHVLCEKPMAVTSDECERMIAACARVRLMIAYRLHLDEANLRAVEIAQSGEIGDLRIFVSTFSMQVKSGDIRLEQERGGGTLHDIGIYCINAARYLFRDEPQEVAAISASSHDARFQEVDEMTGAVLQFPHDRLALFVSSFGAADVSSYRIVGTEGDVRLEPAYSHSEKLVMHLTREGKTKKTVFPKRSQFAAELSYFSQCVLEGRDPQPSGKEGLADVRIIEAIQLARSQRQSIPIDAVHPPKRPTSKQIIRKADVAEPELVNASRPRR